MALKHPAGQEIAQRVHFIFDFQAHGSRPGVQSLFFGQKFVLNHILQRLIRVNPAHRVKAQHVQARLLHALKPGIAEFLRVDYRAVALNHLCAPPMNGSMGPETASHTRVHGMAKGLPLIYCGIIRHIISDFVSQDHFSAPIQHRMPFGVGIKVIFAAYPLSSYR